MNHRLCVSYLPLVEIGDLTRGRDTIVGANIQNVWRIVKNLLLNYFYQILNSYLVVARIIYLIGRFNEDFKYLTLSETSYDKSP